MNTKFAIGELCRAIFFLFYNMSQTNFVGLIILKCSLQMWRLISLFLPTSKIDLMRKLSIGKCGWLKKLVEYTAVIQLLRILHSDWLISGPYFSVFRLVWRYPRFLSTSQNKIDDGSADIPDSEFCYFTKK